MKIKQISHNLWTKTKHSTLSGSFQQKLQHRCFHLWCLLAFITSLLYYVCTFYFVCAFILKFFKFFAKGVWRLLDCSHSPICWWFLGVADHQMTSPLACYKPLQILISANECKISVGLSVPTNSLTTFDLHNWHEPTNRQPTNFVGLSVPTNSLTNFDLIKQGFNWHEPTNRQLTNFVGLSAPTNSLTNFDLIKREFNWHEPTNRQLTNFVGLTVPTNSLTNFDLIKQEFYWHEPTNRQRTTVSSWNEGEMWCGSISSLENGSIKPICIS